MDRDGGDTDGSIIGAAAERIAPTRRFYAGGGGSVRGYGYQQIDDHIYAWRTPGRSPRF